MQLIRTTYLSWHFVILVGGGFFVGFALFLFVVGLADDEVAGDVEAGIGGVEGGF